MKTTLVSAWLRAGVALVFVSATLFAGTPFVGGDRILEPGRTPFLLGPFGVMNYNLHNGRFATVDDRGIVCCEFDNGSGIAPVAGVKAFIPLDERWHVSPRVLYEGRGGEFTQPQQLPILGQGNRVEILDLEERLKATVDALTVDLFAAYKVAAFGLYVAGGPSVSIVVSKTLARSEEITGPPGVTYLDGALSKQFPDAESGFIGSTLISLRAGAGALFTLTRSIYLNPEVLYSFPLNRVSSQYDWKASGLQATFGVMFGL